MLYKRQIALHHNFKKSQSRRRNSPAALLCLYPSKFSYSDIKQNSPNILPTVKRFKLLRLGAGNRTRTGTLFTARDFKSLVSTYSTIPATVTIDMVSYFYFSVKSYSWSKFKLKGSRQFSTNQSNSGNPMARMASMVCSAAESNSELPAFCSSTHFM